MRTLLTLMVPEYLICLPPPHTPKQQQRGRQQKATLSGSRGRGRWEREREREPSNPKAKAYRKNMSNVTCPHPAAPLFLYPCQTTPLAHSLAALLNWRCWRKFVNSATLATPNQGGEWTLPHPARVTSNSNRRSSSSRRGRRKSSATLRFIFQQTRIFFLFFELLSCCCCSALVLRVKIVLMPGQIYANCALFAYLKSEYTSTLPK